MNYHDRFYITDDNNRIAELDSITWALETIDYSHHEIHRGSHYFVSGYEILGSSATASFFITTPDSTSWAHMTFTVQGTDKVTLKFCESASGITGGSSITPINNDRNSSNTSGLTLLYNATAVNTGSTIDSYSAGASKRIGNITRDEEIILKQNTTYYFQITSGAASNTISYKGSWYEHINRE